jgi:hypothetical protein
MLSASLVGYAIGGAFLSVTYYPHMLVLSGLFVAATSIYEREREAMRKGGEETQEYGSKATWGGYTAVAKRACRSATTGTNGSRGTGDR